MSVSRIGSLAIAAICLLSAWSAAPETADAARGIAVINTGQDIFPAGELPEPYNSDPQLANAEAGFMCDIWGIFWTYFKISDCVPVAMEGDTYYDDAELVAAIGEKYTRDDMKVPFWAKWGKFLVGIPVVLLILLGIFGKDEDDEEPVVHDPDANRPPV